ncbi:NADH-quinone oxidoreductase subunit L [Sphingobacterium deserti]|uniref:Proton-translocating NADH-quinone oxidoreductase, chain L n=1 Tax=Sphingobacterium deserti TaxID=1229276 RepID=A0A0B8TA05_9SPHI|nr:NADH-quinone oxidoreductase subunit L [Sphingobacterium deserti]KGE14885.1 proton-translocating NADH-quinone oxidoreductase, chain L [Sphingobacterium deserti]
MSELIWLIPLLPFFGFVINGFIRNRAPKALIALIGCGTVLGSFVLSVFGYLEIAKAREAGELAAITTSLFEWFSVGNIQIAISFLLDPLSAIMLLIITGVGFFIHLYSSSYMAHDAGFGKFFAYLNLFIFFMTILVLGSNYLVMFIGWEGVGLCSYLLIGFWFKNSSYASAAKKAFVMNRIGDLGFLLALFFILETFGSLEYTAVFSEAAGMAVGDSTLLVITLLLFVAATGKSAQIPLFTWLPDAMAGPTPVSALIHAATMVTAGIYMVVRSNVLFTLSPLSMEIMAVVGAVTAFVAAFIAITQNDIKKVLAYSTVSQLGYMFLGLGVGAFTGAFFHVLTHAFFKALLFLGAGSVIHALHDEQDMRKMGGLRKALPITFVTMLIGTIAISGIPPFAGFFSKDEILAHAYQHHPIFWVLGFITALFTAFYMFRLLFLTFFGEFRGTEEQKRKLHESPWQMTTALLVLAFLSIVGGFVNVPEVLGGGQKLAGFLAPIFANSDTQATGMHLSHMTEYVLMGLSVLAALMMALWAYVKYVKNNKVPIADNSQHGILYKLSYHKLYVDELYDTVIVKPLRGLSLFFFKYVDRMGIDGFVNGVGDFFIGSGKGIRLLQSGHIGFYIIMMVFSAVAILIYGILHI